MVKVTEVTGLDWPAVEEHLSQPGTEAQVCIDAYPPGEPELHFELRFDTTADGRPVDVEVRGEEEAEDQLRICLERAIPGAAFPKPKSDAGHVAVAIDFASGE